MNQSILEKYDRWEDVSAAERAWITIRAEKVGKDPNQVRAGYKAHFTRIQKATTITILKEDLGYLGGCCDADPYHHIIKARSKDMLMAKVGEVYDEILDVYDDTSAEYEEALEQREDRIYSIVMDLEEVNIGDHKLKIVSNPEYVSIR